MLGVINDILDLSKIEAGEMYLNEEDFGLSEIVLQCNQIMSLKAKNVGIEINISNQAKDILVNADRRYITQIILNLMSNSLKYTHKGGEINITFDKIDDGCPYVEIEDNGAGISKSDLTIILEPFRQARSNAAISHEGTGLGLSLCVKLIELHGGSLNIESVLGKGTSVTVMLPANRLVKDNSAPKEKTDSVLKLESVF